MGNLVDGVKDNEFTGEEETVTHRTLVEDGARVVARDWGVIVEPGVLSIGRVKGAADEVIGTVIVTSKGL